MCLRWNSERMNDLPEVIAYEWGQNMRKDHVEIAGLINNDFEPLEKLTDWPSYEMKSTDRKNGYRWTIRRGRSESYKIFLLFLYIHVWTIEWRVFQNESWPHHFKRWLIHHPSPPPPLADTYNRASKLYKIIYIYDLYDREAQNQASKLYLCRLEVELSEGFSTFDNSMHYLHHTCGVLSVTTIPWAPVDWAWSIEDEPTSCL